MEKSPEAFRTISEVADFLETPAHVLRFWESRFPQIRPVKRAGGRRYYRPGDVALLAGIKKLLHDEGMTIRGVQKILREHGIRHVAGLAEGFSGDAGESPLDPLVDSILFRTDLDADDENPEADGTRSAQIISLEVALGRAEQATTTAAAEPTWPHDPQDMTSDVADVALWPADEQDTPPAPDVAGLQASGQAADKAADPTDEAHGPDQAAELDLAPMEARVADTAGSPDVADEARAEAPSEQAASAADGATEESPLEEASDLVPVSEGRGADSPDDEPGTDAEAAIETTLAALLRRRSVAQLADRQADLILLRDRLSDLRNRVAEAARRRVK